MKITELKRVLEEEENHARGRYQKALYEYAWELVNNIVNHHKTTAEELEHIENITDLKERALNGAEDWKQYSNGSSLVFNYDILNRLFCPSFVKRHENADTVRGVHLLDLQAIALSKAFNKISRIVKINK